MILFKAAFVYEVKLRGALRVEALVHADCDAAVRRMCWEHGDKHGRFLHMESIEPLPMERLVELSTELCPN